MRSPSKMQTGTRGSQDGSPSVMSKMKRSMTILAGRPISESGMTERSNRVSDPSPWQRQFAGEGCQFLLSCWIQCQQRRHESAKHWSRKAQLASNIMSMCAICCRHSACCCVPAAILGSYYFNVLCSSCLEHQS